MGDFSDTNTAAIVWCPLCSQVCLDCRPTVERELDTVEVLKALQKAKEVKDRMSSSDKKVTANHICHT